MLCHENVHYSHRDNLWVVVRMACLCLHWYNPLVWGSSPGISSFPSPRLTGTMAVLSAPSAARAPAFPLPVRTKAASPGAVSFISSRAASSSAKPLCRAENLPARELGKFLADENGQIYADALDGGLVVTDLNFDGYEDCIVRLTVGQVQRGEDRVRGLVLLHVPHHVQDIRLVKTVIFHRMLPVAIIGSALYQLRLHGNPLWRLLLRKHAGRITIVFDIL